MYGDPRTPNPPDRASTIMPRTDIAFVRLPTIPLETLVAHMNDPRTGVHMPLLTSAWTTDYAAAFVAAKEACWHRDGLGHWAILEGGRYIGWGGFQKEGDEWDFGLVLIPDAFGLGARITRQALAVARADPRIPYITFLLPPSRKHLGALGRMGAERIGAIEYDGAEFGKYRLDTGP
ncbi:GNAT family N-acetyltransferase [Ovoidimarina sediminis]|uniref:GNAT family N-acetyltransferase n=1 Tax=Ovoidimarina sediminis TaxID=3079856 RepID=UPI00290D6F0C|nr:GNAT family N-acetyltransferase [Rhodophyticola sp. MJ-SS7]MDU8944052.1 GNAT family N-acetyltransferase [Rhodophyticola sp. MJ-SS7]